MEVVELVQNSIFVFLAWVCGVCLLKCCSIVNCKFLMVMRWTLKSRYGHTNVKMSMKDFESDYYKP